MLLFPTRKANNKLVQFKAKVRAIPAGVSQINVRAHPLPTKRTLLYDCVYVSLL